MSTKVPTLSSAAWVDSPADKADQLISLYFVADASQTHLYPGEVVSLPAQVQRFGHDALELRINVRQDLEKYLKPYFDAVTLNVVTDVPNPQDPERINLTINCVVEQGGERYSLGRLITTINSKIVSIVDVNNNKGG